MSTRAVGNQGEELACKYLQKLKFKILERNFYIRGGEIDIVSQKNGELIFFEVKTRYSQEFGPPEESLTFYKIKALLKSAKFYIQKINWGNKPYRFHLLAIDYTFAKGKNPQIKIIEDINL